MSGGGRRKGPIDLVLDAIALGALFGIVYAGVHLAPGLRGQAGFIGALGFLLLAGTLMSELVEVLGLPHMTGYLLAGVVAGPHVLALVDQDSVDRLAPVNTLAIALIALAGGAELRLDGLRLGLKSLVVTSLLHTFLGIVVLGGVFFAARPGFVAGMPTIGVIGVSILWGVAAVTRSPSALLAILSETRANGPLARFAVQFVMSSDVVVVVVLAAAITIAKPLVDPAGVMTFEAFRALGHEILGSVAMGTTLGLVLAAYLRLSGKQLLLVLVALGFGATETLHYLNLEPLLTFLVAGFVVQNLSKQGPKFLHALEETGGVVYVAFFAVAGSALDVPLLQKYWPIALLLTGSRLAVTFGLGRVSHRLAGDAPVLRTWGWTPLVAQAGVANGIAMIVARAFPTFGREFASMVLACVAVNAVVGPILFKFALDRTEETRPPAPTLSDAEAVPA